MSDKFNAIETLRDSLPPKGMTSLPVGPITPVQALVLHDALARVDTLYQAAKPVAAKLIEGSWRNATITKAEIEALAVAVRDMETGQ